MTNPSAPSAPAPGGVIDLLGLLAYAELVSFFRLADVAGLAPDLVAKGELAGVAATEYRHYRMLHARLEELGADPEAAMEPFVEPLDAWHAGTEPQNWLESLVKIYVGDGIAGDFYRTIADHADAGTAEAVRGAVSESERAEPIAARVRAAVEEDPKLAGPLSLWARRLVGEALSQAQLVAAARPELAGLVARGATGEASGGGEGGGRGDLAAVSRVFAGLTEAHTARLEAMGLSG
ncbi:ferritin-like fold-containing protein [Nocardiopsis baichengensis]|uniref:ferritin-like fold-containing protein n=1 Tax=Nocardiopsis baichengensis TaxID=280240 RepID=UPI000349346F|nr:ferritin-like fold-containing protein [Nocardiopsis baichengensis]